MADNSLSRFERYIQTLLEGTFAQLFAGRLHPREVALALAQAMDDHTEKDKAGRRIAPDVYVVRMNSADYAAILATRPDLSQDLENELLSMARSVGLTLILKPSVRLLPSESQRSQTVEVAARHSEEARSVTATLDVPAEEQDTPQPEATLVMKSGRHIPLDKPLLNIGRHRDNHVIIDDGRVSRHHAQIRLRFGKYVLFDTGSTGGTEVNGQRISEVTLRSGDVISLAGYTLLFLEQNTPSETSSHNGP
jgi:hypothetical protein